MTEADDTATSLRCFVIGPIGNKFEPLGSPSRNTYEDAIEVFERVIQPACQALNLEPVRADQIAVPGEITEQVFRHLHDDEVVIADLSGANPNVMYELGLRHSRNLLTIQIGEYGQLPFDVNVVRTLQFSRSERGLIDARKSLERFLTAGLAEGLEPVAATRIWMERSGQPEDAATSPIGDPSSEREDEPEGHEVDEDGLLDRLAAIEDSFPLLNEDTDNIGRLLEQLGAVAQDASQEVTRAPGDLTASGRLAIFMRFAKALQGPADDLTITTNSFAGHMGAINADVQGILRFVNEHPEMATGPDVDRFLESLSDSARTAREAMEGLSQLGASIAGIAGISRSVRRPAQQIVSSIRVMADSAAVMDDWDSMSRAIRRARQGAGSSGSA